MKLHYSQTSPYVRKVRVLALETGLHDRIELVARTPSPLGGEAPLLATNPLGKIPALELDDGTILYDSPVICEYLDGLHDGDKLFPQGLERWSALRRQALCDGILDAAVLIRYETVLRPPALRWPDWTEGQYGKVKRALATLEQESGDWRQRPDIGTITAACALGYLDFRYPDLDWRSAQPDLAQWYAGFLQRASMQATLPPAG